jgi:large subunit ribosomal protein L4
MQANVINGEGKVVGQVELPKALFGGDVHEGLLWEAVKAHRASRRAGTHDTRTRGDVRGGGAKPLKQKGSGQARQGSSRAPNHVGGGTVFGPHPRNYAYRLPRSARRRALLSALAARAKGSRVSVLEGLSLEAPKTRAVAGIEAALEGKGCLFVGAAQESLRKSSRNLAHSKGLDVAGLNVYDVLRFDHLVLTREALAALSERLDDTRETPQTEGAAA